MEDLEDDVELESVPVVKQPRKLSRLTKGCKASADLGTKLTTKAADGSVAREGSQCWTHEANVAAEPKGESADEADAVSEGEEDDGGDEVSEGDEDEGGEQQEGAYWDEEDEIENYLKDRFEGAASSDDEENNVDAAGQSAGGALRAPLGDNPTMEDLAAETQRILRETAARDRVGKGHRIEIKPMSSIVAKLLERRALVIERARKLRLPEAVSFDDVMAATSERLPDADAHASAAVGARALGVRGTADAPPEQQAAAGSAEGASFPAADDDLDLDIVSEDEAAVGAAARTVELPSTTKKAAKPSPLAYLPYTQSRELDEFEEAPLVDDGAGSDDDSDDGSERSWEVRAGAAPGDEDDEKEVVGGEKESGDTGSSGEDEERDEDQSESEEAAAEGLSVGREPSAGDERETSPAGGGVLERAAAAPGVAHIGPKHAQRMQRAFLDMEAELSDDGGTGVSEDEDDDDVDDRGELADLIASGNKESGRDKELKDSLHRQWEAQKEAKELQQVLRGLEQGFRRRRGADALDGEGEGGGGLDGRRRRARADGDGDDLDLAALRWPAAWGMGGGGAAGAEDDDECDGEELLRRAKQQRLLAESQGAGQLSPGALPLDEDSQAVIDLIRVSETAQSGAGLPAFGSDPGGSLAVAPSFLGRQPSVARTTGAMGLGGGKSFVFGQRDSSNSGFPEAAKAESKVPQASLDVPVSFANLRHMAGLPGNAAAGKRQREASSLVSRLGSKGAAGKPAPAEGPSLDAASAFCRLLALPLGPNNRRR